MIVFLLYIAERIFQYDTLVCPQQKQGESWALPSDEMPSWLSSASEFDQNKVGKISMLFFLELIKEMIASGTKKSYDDMCKISDQVVNIFHCFYERQSYRKSENRVHFVKLNSVKEVS